MNRRITEALAAWLDAGNSQSTKIGEIAIIGQPGHPGGFELRHHLDACIGNLETFTNPEDARAISLYDTAGEYRPLKTAPNLKRGWKLTLASIEELQQALDFFYPAMLAARLALDQRRLTITPLRETLNRQTGMYAVTKRISDADANAVIAACCRTDGACLKQILWQIAPGLPVSSLPPDKFIASPAPGEIPLLCAEACNLLVAKARETVKRDSRV